MHALIHQLARRFALDDGRTQRLWALSGLHRRPDALGLQLHRGLAVLAALVVDALWGEPPTRWHPVVWMGRALDAAGQRIAPAAPTGRDLRSFWLAALAWCALAALFMIAAALLQAGVQWLLWGGRAPAMAPLSSAALRPAPTKAIAACTSLKA